MIPSEKKSRIQDAGTILAAARSILEQQWDFYSGSVPNDQATKLDADFYELALYKHEERLMALDMALSEITAADQCGPSPPNDVSSHPPHPGLPLYAFAWQSKEFGRKMYLKFAITTKGTPRLVLYSFHPARF